MSNPSMDATVLEILPPPFSWCSIPAGQVNIWGTTYDVQTFEIAKYPITGAQFRAFMDAEDGYKELFWWQFSIEAKTWWQQDQWLQTYGRVIVADDYPCVLTCWYEAVAFCRWLDARLLDKENDETGSYLNRKRIMLPTEAQWQWAAVADTGWAYPWGNEFDAAKCNSSIGQESYAPTKVNRYEGTGDSPFGVVDMCGNVEEWLLNQEKEILQPVLDGDNDRAVRGGNWMTSESKWLRVDFRDESMPNVGFDNLGFRIARS